MPTYGSLSIPNTQISTRNAGTVSVSAAFNSAVCLIGGYDTANGAATAGELTEVSDITDAQDKFGDPSELTRQTALAFANGASTVYGVPVAETSTTENFAATSSGTLTNVPFDPNVQPEHDITAEDDGGTTITVNEVYDYPPTAPSDADTINLNPVTGEWVADSSDTYDITYDYGDYANAVTGSNFLDQEPRFTALLVDGERATTEIAAEMNAAADNFNTFGRSVFGGEVGRAPSAYSDSTDDQRLIASAIPRANSVNDNEVRTAGIVAAKAASASLGQSITYSTVTGIDELLPRFSPYGPSEASKFINDHEALPLLGIGGVRVVKGITTSTTPKFGRIHKVEIVDEVTELTNVTARQFISEPNTPAVRSDLRNSIVSFLESFSNDTPPLLAATDGAQPYSVTVTSASDTQIEIAIGIDVLDVMETFDITINVGDVITNGGAA